MIHTSEVILSKLLSFIVMAMCILCGIAFCEKPTAAAGLQVRGGSVFSEGDIDISGKVDYGIISNSTIGSITENSMTIEGNGNRVVRHSADIKRQLINHFVTDGSSFASSPINPTDISSDHNYTAYCPTNASRKADGSCDSAKSRYRITRLNGGSAIKQGSSLQSGYTHVIYSKGDLTISSDLTYDDTYPYINAFYVPQYIIYAKGNIYIDKNVTEINAILISDGTVYTCKNSLICILGSQLTIKGAVLSKDFTIKRLTGAQVIHSATTSFWANSKSEDYSRMTTTYIRELAPRV